VNSVLALLQTYPFVRLDEAKAAACARGIELIDFGIAHPIEPTPELLDIAESSSRAPGSYFGPSGEGYARLALVPSLEECERAAAILEEIL
jgi:aspartate/methionine/tyrosine aminotransferase